MYATTNTANRVPNIIAASIAVSFIGFFTGPLFATVSQVPVAYCSTSSSRLFTFAILAQPSISDTFPLNTNVTGHISRLQIISSRDTLHRAGITICICTNGRISVPNHHRCRIIIGWSQSSSTHLGRTALRYRN